HANRHETANRRSDKVQQSHRRMLAEMAHGAGTKDGPSSNRCGCVTPARRATRPGHFPKARRSRKAELMLRLLTFCLLAGTPLLISVTPLRSASPPAAVGAQPQDPAQQ